MEKCNNKLTGLSIADTEIPFVLSIAGMDPSAGAGLLADIKTFQAQRVYGLGIISCNTIQTDEEMFCVEWQNIEMISRSLKTLSARFAIRSVKIGVIKDRIMLQNILVQIKEDLPEASVVWDPVLSASAGMRFMNLEKEDLNGENSACWKAILACCQVITPNATEAVVLCRLLGLEVVGHEFDSSIAALDPLMRQMCRYTAVVLKGGHLKEKEPGHSKDRLYQFEPTTQTAHVYEGEGRPRSELAQDVFFEKHGSGCVHSSLLAAMLAYKVPLRDAVAYAKKYMEVFLAVSEEKLGVHPLTMTDKFQFKPLEK